MELARAALVIFCLRQGYGLIGLATIALSITLVQYTALGVLAKALGR